MLELQIINLFMSDEIRILLIEDTPEDLVAINIELHRAGLAFCSKRVDSKAAFLHELEHDPPDVILSDQWLVSFDGFTALAIARQKCPDAPFIFVTDSLGEEMAVQMLESGATDYVIKSNLSRLAPAVRRALRETKERALLKRQEQLLRDSEERFRMLVEQRVRERTAELEAANRELEAFGYFVSHDLRAPLRYIASYADILQNEADLDESSRQHLGTIVAAVRNMGVLIDALLAFSRMARTEMHLERVNLTALVQDAQSVLRQEFAGREVQWKIGELPEVKGDPVMLRLVIVNLLSNALKYTRTQPKAVIEIGTTVSGGEIVVFVRDNGVGFDMNYADKLFVMFQRLHPAREFEGTGIGLANVRRIIDRHGGRTWAEGAVDCGATFYFSLPETPKGNKG